jgi:DNA-directed RNA polymerase subunit E'/Rpb7
MSTTVRTRKPRAKKLVIKEDVPANVEMIETIDQSTSNMPALENAVVKNVIEKPKRGSRPQSIYLQSLLTRRLVVSFSNVGKNLRTTLENILRHKFEGKCGPEGFIKPNSIKIVTHSTGLLEAGGVSYVVGFECLVCNPVEGMHIKCVAKNITKAGIRAEIDDLVSPAVIFIARDHHFESKAFNEIKEEDHIMIRVIGQRFELNDKYISIIGQFLEKKTKYAISKPNN